MATIFIIATLICIALAAWRAFTEWDFTRTSTPAEGIVSSISRDARKPVITFTDATGQARTFSPSSSNAFTNYFVGQKVPIRVSKLDSAHAKIDATLYLWDTTTIFLFLSVVSGVFGALTRTGKFVWGPLKQGRFTVDS